ncbi:Ras-like GTP-binding protein RYL2 [Penicillium chermesinum]|uniref:Ras-like GTP-binding protein RYL2 n=1 Tax=Penicillium chermesinum TaxID=63820 RepID=A0A9W9NJ75_9EURO|nr:Ras-like GTP-binding protein RYL2 [Penicillium chermesinum]KAJ5219609.1 Ras-like GTP-binding protein RYL2 [Penicillium chermesinum]KAJ6153620.1 Ras-like GTP-binding protein RYL2 [Penicillium chermesinum]
MSSSLEAKIVVLGGQGVGKTSLVHRYVRNEFKPAVITSTVGASFVTQRVIDTTSDTTVRLQIWDTAGQERFRSISRLYYRGAHACLLCYDITDENSFHEMAGWLRELRMNVGGGEGDSNPLVIHVVGTKSDIVADDPSKRRVPFERTIAYVAEQLYPSRASTPPPSAGIGAMGLGFGSAVFGSSAAGSANGGSTVGVSQTALQSPDSKRSSAFWGQEIGWDCCHEISAKDGEGIDEVFRVIARKLVEQRNRRDAEAAGSVGGTPGVPDSLTPATPGYIDPNGSFRLGYGDKRRSWFGQAPTVGDAEEVQIMQTARRRGRCC